MNPSYNSGSSASGGSSTPGVKPGVIASGPDAGEAPTIEIPNETSSGLSLGSAKHLFRKPQTSMPKRTTMISGGGSVGGGNSQGSKKGLVIVGLLVIVLLIVGVFAWVIMGGGNGGGGGSNSVSSSTFNELINYVTSGKESTVKVDGQYSARNNYYFLDGWEDEEGKVAVYNKTKGLMDSFVAEYQDGDNISLNNLVKSTKEQFDFMYAVELKEEVIDTDIVHVETKEDRSTLKNKLLKYYDLTGLDDNVYAKEFAEVYKEWVGSLVGENGTSEGSDTGSYRYVAPFFDMEENFVANIYNINSLMYDKVNNEVENE